MATFEVHSEEDLVEAASSGNRDAYADLVRQHQAVAFRVAWSLLRDADEAEDAAQDAFIKAWTRLDQFRPGAPFRPWLLKIVANEARNRLRGSGRRKRREFAVAVPDLAATDPESDMVDREHARMLHQAVLRLDPRERDTIVCRYFLELSEAETSALLDVPRGTVKSRLNRARRSLAVALVPDGDPT